MIGSKAIMTIGELIENHRLGDARVVRGALAPLDGF